jgi:hypothetical protein
MHIDLGVLQTIQEHLHAVMRTRAGDLIEEHKLQLPKLVSPLPSEQSKAWFPIPGMYGGFSYWFVYEDKEPKLVVESWSRVVGGSGQRHEITVSTTNLVEEGFV